MDADEDQGHESAPRPVLRIIAPVDVDRDPPAPETTVFGPPMAFEPFEPALDDAPDADDDLVDVAGWERYLAAYDQHATRLFRIALLLLHGDRHDAEDALQEVFLTAHRPWRDGRVDDLGAYLRRSLTNRVTSRGRHRTVVDRFVRSRRADGRGALDVGDEATDAVALQRALDSLPPKQRAAVVLRYYEGLSIAETASALGVTDGTVKSQVSDALHKLRDVLGVHA